MKRKIIQIAVEPETDTQYRKIYALTDDGSLWIFVDIGPGASWNVFDTSKVENYKGPT